jgi:uncharacterized protein (DUF1810 family)
MTVSTQRPRRPDGAIFPRRQALDKPRPDGRRPEGQTMPDETADPHELRRFVDAQAGIYASVCAELSAGRKATHWMWYVFPQLRGLGRSATAERFGIGSLDEARAYLEHPLLGPRLEHCTRLVLGVHGRTAHEIFGSPDDLKFRSSMTLYAQVCPGGGVFAQALRAYFDGADDAHTLRLLGAEARE